MAQTNTDQKGEGRSWGLESHGVLTSHIMSLFFEVVLHLLHLGFRVRNLHLGSITQAFRDFTQNALS